MAKKVVRLKEQELKEIIIETTQTILNKSMLSEYENPTILIEMARINKREGGNGIFPYSTYEVKIWSDDHEPPHFHVLKDGWNISFVIESGELYKVESRGKNLQEYNYIVSNAKKWLSSKCAINPTVTNQQNAMIAWEQNHD